MIDKDRIKILLIIKPQMVILKIKGSEIHTDIPAKRGPVLEYYPRTPASIMDTVQMIAELDL